MDVHQKRLSSSRYVLPRNKRTHNAHNRRITASGRTITSVAQSLTGAAWRVFARCETHLGSARAEK